MLEMNDEYTFEFLELAFEKESYDFEDFWGDFSQLINEKKRLALAVQSNQTSVANSPMPSPRLGHHLSVDKSPMRRARSPRSVSILSTESQRVRLSEKSSQKAKKAYATLKMKKSGNDLGSLAEQMFDTFDIDGDGSISREELRLCLQDIDPDFSEENADLIFDRLDVNKDADIS